MFRRTRARQIWPGLLLGLAAALPAAGQVAHPAVPERFAKEPAVVLEDTRSWTVDPRKETERYEVKKRVLIQDRRGFDEADQAIFYYATDAELARFAAHTVLPDGRTIDVPKELQHDSTYFREGDREYRLRQFTFPGVEVGAVLEWEYVIEEEQPRLQNLWSVQSDIPVVEARFHGRVLFLPKVRFSMKAFSRAPYEEFCTTRERSDDRGRDVEVQCRELPPLKDEPHAPPEDDRSIEFILHWWHGEASTWGQRAWSRVNDDWGERIRDFLETRTATGELARSLVGEGLSTAEKVDRIYAHVKEKIKLREGDTDGLFDGSAGTTGSVDQVLERGGGHPVEVTLLTLALLREAGITAHAVLVNDRSDRKLLYDLPDFSQADHLMIQVDVDGQPVFLDPACDYCRVGIPDWRHATGGRAGIRVRTPPAGHLPVDVATVPAEASAEIRRERMLVAPGGGVTLTGTVTWSGHQDVGQRRLWDDLTGSAREESLLRAIAGTIDQPQVRISDPKDVTTPLEASYELRLAGGGIVAVGDRILIRPRDVFCPRLQVPVQPERRHPIWLPYAYTIRSETVFVLPEGYAPSRLPTEPVSIEGPGLSFRGAWSPGEAPGELLWAGLLRVEETFIEPEQYPAAREFATRLRRELRNGLVLARAAAPPSEEAP